MAVVENHFGFKSRQVLTGKSGERFGAVIGGQLDVLMEQPGDVSKYVEAGNLKRSWHCGQPDSRTSRIPNQPGRTTDLIGSRC